MKLGRFLLLGLMVGLFSACQSYGPAHCHGGDCGVYGSHSVDHDHDHLHKNTNSQQQLAEGLVVGAVVNAEGAPKLAEYKRWRYTDQLASHILASNPELSGSVDSYQYLRARVGKPLEPLLQEFRRSGDLSANSLNTLKSAQLRRRYLMLANIAPREETLPLKTEAEPVVGPYNSEVHDYQDLTRHTVLLTRVHVQIYDTFSGRKIFDDFVRSDDGGQMLATRSRSRQYVGNSVVAAITNTIANGLTGTVAKSPSAPAKEDVLGYIWSRVAQKLPGDIFEPVR